MRSGWVVGGPRLAEFEERFAAICGARHAVGVSSWTTGAFLVLHAWGIGPGRRGDRTVAHFHRDASTSSAMSVLRPYSPTSIRIHTISIRRTRRGKITSRTRAIMPVDQIGLPCDIDAFNALARRHDLHILDDAACAFGSRNDGRPLGSLAEVLSSACTPAK